MQFSAWFTCESWEAIGVETEKERKKEGIVIIIIKSVRPDQLSKPGLEP